MNIETFNLNLLRVLAALLETRSVSAAAHDLGLSQPAVSSALARLRTALGDRLLIRRGNLLVPTPLAETLQPEVRRILDDTRRMLTRAGAFDPMCDARRFRIAATDYAAFVVLVPLVRVLAQRAPNLSIDVQAMDDRVTSQLATGVCDLALGGFGFLRRQDPQETLFDEPYVSLARNDHPRLSPVPTLDEFLAERHVMISLHRQAAGVVDEALAKRGLARKIGLTVPNFLVAPQALVGTDMILTTGRSLAQAVAGPLGLRLFPTPLEIAPYGVPMAWHARTEGEPSVEWLKTQIRLIVPSITAAS